MTIETDLDELMGEAPKPAKKAKPEAPEAIKKNTVRIYLEQSDDIPPGGLFLQHNGRPYLLQPGVEVDIPLHLKEILDHAIISMPEVDPRTRQVVGFRDRLKYAYRVIR